MTDTVIDTTGRHTDPGERSLPVSLDTVETQEPSSAETRRRRICWAAMVVVALAVFTATLSGARVFPGYSFDMRQYVTGALVLDGDGRGQAVADAARAWCSGRTSADDEIRQIVPVLKRDGRPDDQTKCVRSAVDWDTRVSPRYTAIFTARVGVAAMYAPFLALCGTFWGMWIASATFAAAAGLLTAALVGAVGGSARAALAGQILFMVLPIGAWAAQPLSEGPVDVLLLTVLTGAALLLRDVRPRLGATLLAGGLIATVMARESTATALCAGLLTAAGVCLFQPGLRRPATVVLAAVGGLGLAATTAWSTWRGDPGITETLQELFTVCFSGPDVSDPWGRLLRLNQGFWLMEIRRQATVPFGIAAMAAAGWLLWSTHRRLMPLLTVPVVIALGTACVHPHIAEAPRLLDTAWITCAVGLAMMVDRRGSQIQAGVAPRTTAERRKSHAEPSRVIAGLRE